MPGEQTLMSVLSVHGCVVAGRTPTGGRTRRPCIKDPELLTAELQLGVSRCKLVFLSDDHHAEKECKEADASKVSDVLAFSQVSIANESDQVT